jgi:hypothetical protein
VYRYTICVDILINRWEKNDERWWVGGRMGASRTVASRASYQCVRPWSCSCSGRKREACSITGSTATWRYNNTALPPSTQDRCLHPFIAISIASVSSSKMPPQKTPPALPPQSLRLGAKHNNPHMHSLAPLSIIYCPLAWVSLG